MSERADLLFVLGLPAWASAREIELVYLERRAEARKRLDQPLGFARRVHYATGYGCPEAKNLEDQA